MVKLGGLLGGVADGDQVYMVAEEEAAVGAGVFVDADGYYGQAGQVMMQIKQRRRFFHTGPTPGGPEVEQHHLASVAGQMN